MEIKYTTVRLDDTDGSDYNSQDLVLAGEYSIFTKFNPLTDFIEANYTINGEVLSRNPDYRNYRTGQDSEYTLDGGVSRISLNPEQDVITIGYMVPETIVSYNFYRNLFRTPENQFERFYLDSISDDRKELRLYSLNISASDIKTKSQDVINRLNSEATFSDFNLLFENGHTELAINLVNVVVGDRVAVIVKLYNPLTSGVQLKTELQLVEEVSETLNYSVLIDVITPPVAYKKLAGPNFNSSNENRDGATEYLSSVDLINVNTYSTDVLEVISKTFEKSATLGIDYSKLSNFIHYSSASERLKNFVYKAQLIENYNNSLNSIPSGTSGNESREFYEVGIKNIVRNFDHFERYLYFESGSLTWPKRNSVKPYNLFSSTASVTVNWYSDYLNECDIFDNTNYYRLMGSLPEYIREDSDNSNLVLFVDMLGHHFDNIKIYSDAVSNKYNADNRVDRGLATSLIEPVLENFGVKLHKNEFKTNQDLFKYFVLTDDSVDTEIINTTSSLSNVNVSEESYRQEIYKRVYHNLPILLKSKGTERGLKVLMSTFGIPSNIFPVKTYGGASYKDTPYFGLELPNVSGSFSKIRLDTTGSIEGTVLVPLTSIQKREADYQPDLHIIEVGPSPNDNINRYILQNISSSFNIDEYIGNPSGYDKVGLRKLKESILFSLDRYDLKDFIRLIRFYDNSFFRMVRDFVPGRDVIDSGIIIKPHILEHNLVKDFSVDTELVSENLEGEIDTAFITGSDAGAFGAKSDYVTSYTETLQFPDGLTTKPKTQNGYTLVGRHDGETPRYTGELSGSVLKAIEKELNIDNTFKKPSFFDSFYNITPILTLADVPLTCDPFTATAVYKSTEGGNIIVTLRLGSNVGTGLGPFLIESDESIADPAAATRSELITGLDILLDDASTEIRLTSTGSCDNMITVPITGTPTSICTPLTGTAVYQSA